MRVVYTGWGGLEMQTFISGKTNVGCSGLEWVVAVVGVVVVVVVSVAGVGVAFVCWGC